MIGEHYDVHRYHPPLVYGRRGNAETGEGISLAVGKSRKGEKVYILITYILPIISARAVPQQINFYNDFSKLYFIQLESWSSLTDLKYGQLSIIIFSLKTRNIYISGLKNYETLNEKFFKT